MTSIESGASRGTSTVKLAEGDSGFSLIDILQVLAENLRLLILGPVIVGLSALGLSYLVAPTYTASVKFLPPQQQVSSASSMLQSLGALGSLAGAASGLKNPTDQYVAFLRTRSIQDALVDRFALMERYGTKYRQDARTILEKSSKVEAGKENIITIQFSDRDPSFSAEVANAYVSELTRVLNGLAVTEAQQRRSFFDKQLSNTKDNLIIAEQTLGASGVSTSALNSTPATALEGPARLRAQVTALEVRLASMRSYLTENAPDFRAAAAELGAMRAQLRKTEQQQPASATGGNDYIAKYREFKYQETLFELFARQLEIAKIDESREGSSVQVIDAAIPPEKKSAPKRALIAAGTAIGTGFLLMVFVFMQYAFRDSNRDPRVSAKLALLGRSVRRSFWRT